MRLVTDLMAYAQREIPSWNTISISGYHIREAGSTAVQEVAFTLANAVAYARAAVEAGLEVDDFAPRLSFFFNAHNNFLEEVAKFRAARQLWAEIMRESFGARNPRSLLLRFHTQTAGSALSAIFGGTQSLHTNAFDEALALPTEQAATVALRTQQIIANETDVPEVADPLGGSYLVEYLTDRIVEGSRYLMERVEREGGAVAAIESGFIQNQIEEAAYVYQREIDRGERVIVGVNAFVQEEAEAVEIQLSDPRLEGEQRERLARLRRERDNAVVAAALRRLEGAARGKDNLLYPLKEAHAAYATIGEVSDALRAVFGTHDRPASG
jgi:methylmalonyl-CoA mutase N-terminal domain/subunit